MPASTTRRPLPAVVFLLVLTILTAIVWWRVLHRPSGSTTATTPPVVQPIRCSPGGKVLALPKPSAVSLDVLNGSGREGLASQVSALFRARGFKVGTPGNAPAVVGIGQIQFGTPGKAGATLVSYNLPGAALVTQNRADARITVVLGSAYKSLASTAAVNKAVLQAKKPC